MARQLPRAGQEHFKKLFGLGAGELARSGLFSRQCIREGVQVLLGKTFAGLSFSSVGERARQIAYELLGPSTGTPVVLTPGGKSDRHFLRPFAECLLAKAKEAGVKLRVLLWDRRNMGESSLAFGDRPLPEEEADDLHALLHTLGMAPAVLFGSSSGARLGLLVACEYPQDVRGLILAPPTGGALPAKFLAYAYYRQDADIAARGGMAAVADTPYYKAYLERNPDQRQALLATPAEQFCAAMQRSERYLQQFAYDPLLGLTEAKLRKIPLPTLVMHHGAEDDDIHTRFHAQLTSKLLPNATLEWVAAHDAAATRTVAFIQQLLPVPPRARL